MSLLNFLFGSWGLPSLAGAALVVLVGWYQWDRASVRSAERRDVVLEQAKRSDDVATAVRAATNAVDRRGSIVVDQRLRQQWCRDCR
jgi:nicotinamide riboside transporter PnuC